MDISLAPITARNDEHEGTSLQQEVIHGTNPTKPLFRHLPISRQTRLHQILSTSRRNRIYNRFFD